MRKLWKSKGLGVLVVVTVGLLLTSGVVHGALKQTSIVKLWDAPKRRYESGNASYPLDGTWQSIIHEIGYDTAGVDIPPAYETPGCEGAAQSTYAGYVELGLGHIDGSKDSGQGFQESRRWEIIACDRDGDGDGGDTKDDAVTPQTYRDTLAEALQPGQTEPNPGIWLESQDVLTECSNEQCAWEIVTLLYVNLDTDCDGSIEPLFDVPGGQCFYAEGRTPPPTTPEGEPLWTTSNIQVRINIVGSGEKTVNMTPITGLPTAVTLGSFTGRWAEAGSQPPILWAAIAVVGVGTLGALIWRLRPALR